MSFFNDSSVLLGRLAAQMTANHPTIPVQMPNDAKVQTADLWCQAIVRAGDTKLVSVGPNTKRYRTVGVMMVMIMCKPDVGIGDALGLADDIASYLRQWKSGNLRTRSPNVEDLGLSGGWYQVNVIVPYQSDSFY